MRCMIRNVSREPTHHTLPPSWDVPAGRPATDDSEHRIRGCSYTILNLQGNKSGLLKCWDGTVARWVVARSTTAQFGQQHCRSAGPATVDSGCDALQLQGSSITGDEHWKYFAVVRMAGRGGFPRVTGLSPLQHLNAPTSSLLFMQKNITILALNKPAQWGCSIRHVICDSEETES